MGYRPRVTERGRFSMPTRTRVTIWNEFKHEKRNPVITEIYPQGMHEAIASHLRKSGADRDSRTATLDQPWAGLSDEVLNTTDVVTWWGRIVKKEVDDASVAKVQARLLA